MKLLYKFEIQKKNKATQWHIHKTYKFEIQKNGWKRAWRNKWWKSLHHHDEITKESIDVGTRNKWNNVNTKDEEKHAMVLQAHHTTKGKLSSACRKF